MNIFLPALRFYSFFLDVLEVEYKTEKRKVFCYGEEKKEQRKEKRKGRTCVSREIRERKKKGRGSVSITLRKKKDTDRGCMEGLGKGCQKKKTMERGKKQGKRRMKDFFRIYRGKTRTKKQTERGNPWGTLRQRHNHNRHNLRILLRRVHQVGDQPPLVGLAPYPLTNKRCC